jgi:ribosomal protein S18 acetylase RimI-like enzyme
MSVKIQQATINDVPVIQQIAYKTWPKTYGAILSEAQINYMLQLMYNSHELEHQIQNGYKYLLAKTENQIIGFAAFNEISPQSYKLQKLYILPKAQGTGLGRHLLHHIIQEIKSNGAVSLILNVNRHNNALSFYTKMGFQIIREEDNDIGNGYFMNDYVMQLSF